MEYMRNDPILKERRRDLRHNQTEAEEVFWKHIRDRQFHGLRFERQYSVGPYIFDFYCPALKLAIELDGGQHNEEVNQEYDKARSMYLKAQGIDEMRFWNHEMLRHEQDVVEKLAERVTQQPIAPLCPALS